MTVVDHQEQEEDDPEDDNNGYDEGDDFADLIPFDDDNDKAGGSDASNGQDMEDDESVRALTLKDDVDYDDPQMANVDMNNYGDGYNERDDLNNDGVIDQFEK